MAEKMQDNGGMQEVLIAPPLRIRYLPGRTQRLVISFSGVGNLRHEEPPLEFFRLAGWDGENHVLFVTDESRSWLNGPGMAERIVETVHRFVAQTSATSVIALGNSMGGTMAIHLSQMMPIDAVIALVPQYSADPSGVPEETRWRYFRRKIEQFRFSGIGDLPVERTRFIILHGGSTDEWAHARRFPVLAGLDHYILPACDHNLARTLHADKRLAPILRHAMLGHRWQVRKAVRALGGLSRHQFEQSNGDFALTGGAA
ncbi:MAG: hypothetical protein U1D35_09180 [Paracoccaceae bacterium]|nr:hypothetical protein [Paracoccaceae bacterium]